MSAKQQKEEGSNSFKIIVAIKCAKEHTNVRPASVRCTITIQDKQKSSTLPFSEGQFFDLKELDVSKPIAITFQLEKSNIEIGTVLISIPESILIKEEHEIADEIIFNYSEKDQDGTFRGSYYIIILNKRNFLQKDEGVKRSLIVKDESPKPQGSRTPIKNVKSPGVKKQQNNFVVTKSTKEDESKRLNSAKKLQDRVESSVKNAMKEMGMTKSLENSGQILDNSFQKSHGKLSRGVSLIADLEGQSPTRLSNQVQIARSGKDIQDFSEDQFQRPTLSTQKIQTFNVEDSPSRMYHRGTTSVSPKKHHTHEGYNSHNHSTLACLYYLDSANMSDQLKTQADYFKKVIYNLSSKIEGLKGSERSNDRLVSEVKRQEVQVKDLQKLLNDAQDTFSELKAEINSSLDKAQEDRSDLEALLRQKSEKVNELDRKNADLEQKIDQQSNQIVQMDRRLTELLTINRQSKYHEGKLDENDRTILDNLKDYENKIKQLKEVTQNLDQQVITIYQYQQKQDVQQELNKSQQEVLGLKGDLSEQQHENKELASELGVSDRKLQVYQAQDVAVKALNDQIVQQQKDILELGRQKQHIEAEVNEFKKDQSSLRTQLQTLQKSSNEKTGLLRQKIVDCESRIHQQQNETDILQKDNIKYRQENKDLQRDVKLTKDIQSQVEQEKNKNQVLYKSVIESQNREKELSTNFKEANQLLLQSRQDLADQQNELLETQQYCAQLKKLILEMKESGACYIPFHNDPIDKAVSDFINSLNDPERIKDLFVRESEGVYSFGTKKVYAKIEQDRILIRTGGGFMGIEEFCDMYGTLEIEQMEKADPKRLYDQNKVISEKIDQGRVIRETKKQFSPVRHKSPNH